MSHLLQGANGLLARHDYFGVFATKTSRQPRDVAGQTLQVFVCRARRVRGMSACFCLCMLSVGEMREREREREIKRR